MCSSLVLLVAQFKALLSRCCASAVFCADSTKLMTFFELTVE